MRERKSFAERTKVLPSDETRKKYFLVYEGKYTELLYFDAVNELREDIKISPLIELVPIVRSYSEEGWSNPKKIVKRMIQNIEESQSGNITYETLLNWIMDYFQDDGYIANNRVLAASIWKTLVWICQEKLNVTLYENVDDLKEACKAIVGCLEKEMGLENLVKDVTKIINYNDIKFEEGLDKVCFVVDRDKGSFTASQYDYVLEQCRKRGFGLYLTNPCFEFWLLLHFDDVVELDQEQLSENPLITAKHRYSEHELRKRMPGYKKSQYDAKQLVKKINNALKNEKNYCENIEKLKDYVGCNIGLLIREMKN